MYEPPTPPASLVVHVLAGDMSAETQVFGQRLCHRLDRPAAPHLSLALASGSAGTPLPDHSLPAHPTILGRTGINPGVVRPLRRKLRELAPATVVAHGIEAFKHCARACPPGARLIYHQTASREGVLRHRLQAAWQQRMLKSADLLVATTDELAGEARTVLGVEPGKIAIIPTGLDPEPFRPAIHAGSPVQLTYLAQLTPERRPLWFLDLVRRLVCEHLPVRAVIAGDGPLLSEVTEAARGLPVDVIGNIEPDQVPALLASSHVLVYPSDATDDGLPAVYLQAGLSGLPVVTTAVCGANTVISQRVTGYITPVNSLSQLVGRTRELVVHTDLRAAMGRSARQRCLERFTLDAVAARWKKVIVPRGRAAHPSFAYLNRTLEPVAAEASRQGAAHVAR